MHPYMDFEKRMQCLKDLKKLGYETGSGCLVGLPEQTVESLADDILFFKELDADMIGIGPFIPHPDTPLKDCAQGNFILALKVMAIVRIMLKKYKYSRNYCNGNFEPERKIDCFAKRS